MPGYFFDSSALAKHYHVEIGTAEVDYILQLPDVRHFIARLALVEIRSVFAGKVRTGVISEDDFRLLRRRFHADVTARRLQVVRLTNASYQAAGKLIEQHATHRSLRTLDALHLAVALTLHPRGLCEHFVCADRNLCGIAETEGFSVINPEQP